MNEHLKRAKDAVLSLGDNLIGLGDYGALAQVPEPEPEHPHISFLHKLLNGASAHKDSYLRGLQRAQQDERLGETSNPPSDEQHRWAWHAGYATQRGLSGMAAPSDMG